MRASCPPGRSRESEGRSRASRPPPRGRSPPSTATTDIGAGITSFLLFEIERFVEAGVAFLAGSHPHLEPLEFQHPAMLGILPFHGEEALLEALELLLGIPRLRAEHTLVNGR